MFNIHLIPTPKIHICTLYSATLWTRDFSLSCSAVPGGVWDWVL